MSSQYIGIETARKSLGDLVTAAQQGADIVLTRNGRPAARLTPYKERSMITGIQVVQQMYNHVYARGGSEPFDLIDQSRRAAAALLGEREHDLREETQMRVIEVSLRGIAAMCEAIGVDPDAIDEQPAQFATIGQARDVMATIAETPRHASPAVTDEGRVRHLVDVTTDDPAE